jgi:hypothetical protein
MHPNLKYLLALISILNIRPHVLDARCNKSKLEHRWNKYRRIAKEVKLKPSQYRKFIFIQGEADKGNSLAKQYLEKLKKEEVSIDWAHRVLISGIRQQRMLKMMVIADARHFSYDNEIELVQFIDSEMEKGGLGVNNEENLDSYLNTKFM